MLRFLLKPIVERSCDPCHLRIWCWPQSNYGDFVWPRSQPTKVKDSPLFLNIQLLEKGLSTCHPPMFCLSQGSDQRYKHWLMRVDSRHLLGLTMLSVSTVRLNTGNDLLLEIRVVRLTEIQGLDSGRLSRSFFALIIFPCLELWNWMLNDAQESTKVPKLTRNYQKPLHFHHQNLIQESDNKNSNNFHLHGHFCSPTSATDGHEQTSVGLILTSSAAAASHG